MDLLLQIPFSKFALAIYSVVALCVSALKTLPETKSEIVKPMGADELLSNLRLPVDVKFKY
jgi:hypothetical protein